MQSYRLLIINPGSTSTKMSVFDNLENIATESVFHDAPLLLRYPTTNDQLPMRKKVVLSFLEKHGIPLTSIDVFVGRGGCAYPQGEGGMPIDQRLVDDTRTDKGGSDHPAKLGVMMAWEFAEETGKQAYTVNPTNVDELCDEARITGIKGLYRRPQTHVLNQKGVARLYAREHQKDYTKLNLIVCHIDGGVTITAHRQGRMVDSTEGAGGDGPFSPTRLGSVPVIEICQYLEQGHRTDELRAMCSRSGGFVSHFGTSNADHIHALAEQGDKHARLVWQTMAWQISKSIGSMAAVLEGKVDAILLTGGLVRFPDLVADIKTHCSWIAPIEVYPGEVEQEELAGRVLDVLQGKEQAHSYTGKPVFSGFGWE